MKDEKVRKMMAKKTTQRMLKSIASDPSLVTFMLEDDAKRECLLSIMKAIDADFKLEGEKENTNM